MDKHKFFKMIAPLMMATSLAGCVNQASPEHKALISQIKNESIASCTMDTPASVYAERIEAAIPYMDVSNLKSVKDNLIICINPKLAQTEVSAIFHRASDTPDSTQDKNVLSIYVPAEKEYQPGYGEIYTGVSQANSAIRKTAEMLTSNSADSDLATSDTTLMTSYRSKCGRRSRCTRTEFHSASELSTLSPLTISELAPPLKARESTASAPTAIPVPA